MSLFFHLRVLAMLLAAGTVWAGQPQKPAPNVLVVLADQWRAQAFGFAGNLAGPWLLFDHEKDSGQMNNLAGTPGSARLQAKLDVLLHRKLAQAHDGFLPGPEYISKWGYTVDGDGTVPYEP